MARIIPSDISPLALAGAHSRELETLALLKDQLGPDYAVFHSVHWSFSHGHATHFGEIDFILVNRAGNVLCIEQKNGALAADAIYTILRNTAEDITKREVEVIPGPGNSVFSPLPVGYDFDSGQGFVDAVAAVAATPSS